MRWTPPRRAAALAAAWLVAVVLASWLSWTAIDAAGRQVVAPLPAASVPASAGTATTETGAGTSATTSPTVTATQSPTAPTATPTPTAGPAASRRTVTTAGGTVAAACLGQTPTVEYATPADGWRAEVEQEGGEGLRVDLRSEDERIRLEISCAGGAVQITTEENRSGSGGGGDG